jgi:hypothetical protein
MWKGPGSVCDIKLNGLTIEIVDRLKSDTKTNADTFIECI